MTCLLGFHKYSLYYDQSENQYSKKDIRDYLQYSFTHKNFPMNQRKLEPFETPKVLGDIFEAVIGAVYEDRGLDAVHKVYKHILAPLIMYNCQFCKLQAVYGEPKEQFQWRCNEVKIKPKYSGSEELTEELVTDDCTAMMHRCKVIYSNGKQMCEGTGSSKRQAERNAAVMGLRWLDANREQLLANLKKKQRQESG